MGNDNNNFKSYAMSGICAHAHRTIGKKNNTGYTHAMAEKLVSEFYLFLLDCDYMS